MTLGTPTPDPFRTDASQPYGGGPFEAVLGRRVRQGSPDRRNLLLHLARRPIRPPVPRDLANVLATLVAGWVMVEWGLADQLRWETGRWPGLILALIGVSLWEWSAYSSSVKQATGTFPLDTKLLRDNAVIAAVYMALGALLGLAFHVRVGPALLITAAVVVAAVLLAPRWLRQKIIWQKASIPYLFRLADAAPTINQANADALLKFIDDGAPPPNPRQVVIEGARSDQVEPPWHSGIGTESHVCRLPGQRARRADDADQPRTVAARLQPARARAGRARRRSRCSSGCGSCASSAATSTSSSRSASRPFAARCARRSRRRA